MALRQGIIYYDGFGFTFFLFIFFFFARSRILQCIRLRAARTYQHKRNHELVIMLLAVAIYTKQMCV